MCAIFGSFSKSMFEVLHDGNKERGTWAGSVAAINIFKKSSEIVRWDGRADIGSKISKINGDVFIGHLQAPTGASRSWKYATSHPFVVGDWVVAHNGVITNQDKLVKDHNNGIKVDVDSQLIPIMIDKFVEEFDDSVPHIKSIENALSLVEGTFSVWIYNTSSSIIYIARQGSNLYADESGNFSSINSKSKWAEVPEGEIFELSQSGIISIGSFKNKTPFFIL